MPFPQVESRTAYTFGSGTTHNCTNFPALAAGEVYIALVTSDANDTQNPPTNWTSKGTQLRGSFVRGSVHVYDVDLDETTVNFPTSGTEAMAVHVLVVSGWSGDLDDIEVVFADPGGTTNAPNPPSLDPAGWFVETTLWIVGAFGSSWTAVNGYPTNYATNGAHNLSGTGTGHASISTSWRENATASEDPAAFSMSTTSSGVVATIAVRPSAGGTTHEASAATTITVTGAGAAHAVRKGTASTSVTVTTAASGKARRKATATTSITVTSAGVGKSQPQRATATTLIAVTGGGAAKKTGKRTASTTVTVTSAASGKARRKATATTNISVTSTGSGSVSTKTTHSAAATSNITVSSAGVAHRRKHATGTTSLTVVSVGSVKARRKATAVTEITVNVTGLGWAPREHVGGPSKLFIPEDLVRTQLAIDEKLTRGLLIRIGEED
jgi:hypothetical protein